MNNILLIDDQGWEKDLIGSVCQTVFGVNFRLDHASRSSEAVKLLLEKDYTLVLLDNNLGLEINASFSVPFLKEFTGTAEIVVMSNNIFEDYLEDPAFLGVDHVIAKKDLVEFLVGVSRRIEPRAAAS